MKTLSLKYHQPAQTWFEGLALGSGDLGIMVQEDYNHGIYGINLDSLWSGYPKDKNNPSPKKDWKAIRQHIIDQEYTQAEKEVMEHILGDWTDNYLPAGALHVRYLSEDRKSSFFQRQLSLNDAIYQKQMEVESYIYHHEAFTSLAESIFCLQMDKRHGQESSALSLEISIDSPLVHEISFENDTLILKGKAPSYLAPVYCNYPNPIHYEDNMGLDYALLVKVEMEEGSLKVVDQSKIVIRDGVNIRLYLLGDTSYHIQESELLEQLHQKMTSLVSKGYETLKKEHIDVYQSYYNTLDFSLGESCPEDTLEYLENLSNESTPMYELMFQYARYLMISSSKPGTQASNLQGIWNPTLRAPWSSNYTVNINTQMNYWFVEAANLSACHGPLFDLIEKTAQKGKMTAQNLYGLNGWVSHHNIDLWGHSSPVGYNAGGANSTVYGFWPMSSGWLCRHLWDHYLYTEDKDFLRKKAYPLIEQAVCFYKGYLVWQDGYYMSIPSTSPENLFIDRQGQNHALTVSSTMDISILKELFENYQKARKILGMDIDQSIKEILQKLPPFQIGKAGGLQEWFEDYEEWEVHHRHVSHLYALYPGEGLFKEDAKFLKACANSLNRRDDEGTGWCIAWKACLWARLKEGQRALSLLRKQLRLTREEEIKSVGGGTYPNLFCAHPPFQIDGNFGFAAAIIEMLIQSHSGRIYLLPALPNEWDKGSIRGVKAKGGYELSFTWENHQLTSLTMKGMKVGPVCLVINGQEREIILDQVNQEVEVTI